MGTLCKCVFIYLLFISFFYVSPFSHLESCCSVLIGWCLPKVRKMAKSRPMKSADVPAYSSPSDDQTRKLKLIFSMVNVSSMWMEKKYISGDLGSSSISVFVNFNNSSGKDSKRCDSQHSQAISRSGMA